MIYLEQVSKGAKVPCKATTHAACFDVCADITFRNIKCWDLKNFDYIAVGAQFTLKPGERAAIPTGWKMRCPEGFKIAMYPRSGLPLKHGITLSNCVGVIDSDYSDEVHITLINLSNEPFVINQGDRLAQLAKEELVPCEMEIVEELPPVTSNRIGGFMSTGKS